MRAIAGGGKLAQSAMARVFNSHFDAVNRHLRMTFPRLNEENAADFVAQGFVQAFERADSFRGESGLRTWLVRIASNLVLTSLRREKVVDMVSIEVIDEALVAWNNASCEYEDPSIRIHRDESDDCVRQQFEVFRRSHPQPAWALWARLCDEASLEDLAHLLQKSKGATRQYLSDWGKKLRAFLAPCLPTLKEN